MQQMSHSKETLSALNDERLMSMAVAGEILPFELLVGRYEQEIAGFARKMLRNRDDADDVLQETFLRLWRSRQMYRGGAGFRPYLYAVARNVIRDRQKEMTRTDSQRFSPATAAAQENDPESAERIEALQRAVSELPELERSVLVLAKFQRLSYREISQATGLDLKAVEYRLRKALEALTAKCRRAGERA
jgi:RNA polymerase sigma-70 factor (ECF subfamily)